MFFGCFGVSCFQGRNRMKYICLGGNTEEQEALQQEYKAAARQIQIKAK